MRNLLILVTLTIAKPLFANYGNGVWLKGGLGLGGSFLSSSEDSDVNIGHSESNKSGFSAQVNGGISYFAFTKLILDADLGFSYSKLQGEAPADGLEKVSITHSLAYFQMSPRYRFGEDGASHIGPLYRVYFGANASFAEDSETSTEELGSSHFFGLQTNYDWMNKSKKLLYRVGFNGMMDISDPRSIYSFHFIFEVAFNLFTKGSLTRSNDTPIIDENYEIDPALEEEIN